MVLCLHYVSNGCYSKSRDNKSLKNTRIFLNIFVGTIKSSMIQIPPNVRFKYLIQFKRSHLKKRR